METKDTPNKDFRFWYYSPGGNGLVFFRTEDDRSAYAKEDIEEHLDYTWAEEVEFCCAGEVTHIVQPTEVEHRPADEQEAEEESWPEGADIRCNYALLPITG